ncbi:transcriptional regulator, TetR family [Beutenbergia cavernae DSM 12333]|uniref:Transcriptional regulator, TetR family n=1 Tax=Beutenbergia cavernae (strain ATCC BAA-8 / DSM 12333 / CCUG 43141 / JCM 11478 / NBRC 16432 / NCIMB 13614 / HKI 0122) TaxID=471853 RepID=C5C5G2_BEUC1|nr:TetR/AcrR family transcriptional regulator [Beutenbergia cavernae]ACQ80153.1 transcriptional regulator, TetR family [Beutenbergia cavernae DSM 12333]
MARLAVAERRTLLLDAAWRVLRRDGVAGTTTRAVCAEAGMPQGLFHYCFASRDEMLAEVVADVLPREVSAASSAVRRRGTRVDAVHAALLAYWELVEAEPETQRVIYEITAVGLRDATLAPGVRARYERYPTAVAEVLLELGRVRRLEWTEPVDVLARRVVALLDGLTISFLVDGDAAAARGVLASFAADLARHARGVRR